jgi:hypothetical protein
VVKRRSIAIALLCTAASARASAQTSAPRRTQPAQRRDAERPPATREAQGLLFRASVNGEWHIRGWFNNELPLPTTPGQSTPSTLGQTHYSEQWFRLRPWLTIGDVFAARANLDVTRAIILGESTRQVELSRDNRSSELSPFSHGIVDLRALYIEWTSKIGVLRAGHQQSQWGLGIVANDGDRMPVFGDYRNGDIVERLAFATRPGGERSPLVVALAGDLVFRDRLASLIEYNVPIELGGQPRASVIEVEQPTTRTMGGDWAWQAVLSAFYQDPACREQCERKRVGAYAVYRGQTNRLGDALMAGFADVFARWEWPSPDGTSKVFAAVELALAAGHTTFTRNAFRPDGHDVVQHGGAAQLGVEREGAYRVVLEGGYASGDAQPQDGMQSRFTFNPAHRVGLILFPEVLAWHTARSASIAADPRVTAQAPRGTELLPSSGAVTNAAYFYPTAIINVTRWLDVRTGAVIAMSTSDFVDPVRSTIFGTAQNYRGGSPLARDLGIELDLGFQGRNTLPGGVKLVWGAQGAVMFPGRAWDDGGGQPLPTRWLGVARLGAEY